MTNSRHSYSSVSRFFPALQGMIDAHKGTASIVEVNPRALGLTPTTCAARLRDAIQAVRNNIVVAPMDFDTLKRICPEWVVTSTDDLVFLVHRERQAQFVANQRANTLQVELKGPVVVEKQLTPDQLSALCFLLSGRVIDGEYRVKLPPGLGPTNVESLKSRYDIAIIDNNDGTYTLL